MSKKLHEQATAAFERVEKTKEEINKEIDQLRLELNEKCTVSDNLFEIINMVR